MRVAFASMCLVVALSVTAAVVEACGIYRPAATLQPGVVAGDQFVCVMSDGHLAVRDLKTGKHRDLTGAGLLSAIDVRDNRVCVASDEHVYVVDLATGKALHTLPHAKGPVKVGFADKEHVFAASQEAVEIFDLAAGKLKQRVELRKPRPADQGTVKNSAKTAGPGAKTTDPASAKRSARGVVARPWLSEGIVLCCRHENLLFVALPADDKPRGIELTTLGSVAVIDLDRGRLNEEVQVARGITGLATAGGRLLVRSGIFSYGIPFEQLTSLPISQGKLDVKSKDVRRDYGSIEWGLGTGVTGSFTDGNDQVVANGRTIFRLDAQGKCVAKRESLAPGRELVGVWNGQALVAEEGKLEAVSLTPVEPKPATAD